jgi:hypothetical protein
MAVLVAPKTWRREPKSPARLSPDRLSPEESANVRRALLFLRTRHGGGPKLAGALGVGLDALHRAYWPKGKPGAGLALRAARLAGEPVESLLRGEWPKPEACPHCGRG